MADRVSATPFSDSKQNMVNKLLALLRQARAATAIEYGLIAVAAMQGLGNQLNKTFGNVTTNMKAGA